MQLCQIKRDQIKRDKSRTDMESPTALIRLAIFLCTSKEQSTTAHNVSKTVTSNEGGQYRTSIRR